MAEIKSVDYIATYKKTPLFKIKIKIKHNYCIFSGQSKDIYVFTVYNVGLYELSFFPKNYIISQFGKNKYLLTPINNLYVLRAINTIIYTFLLKMKATN